MRVWLKHKLDAEGYEVRKAFALTFGEGKVNVMDDSGIHEYPISDLIMVAD